MASMEQGSASLMIRVVRLQADLSGLDRRSAGRRADLWPLPGEMPGEEAMPCPADAESGPSIDPPAGPLAEAVRRGRHRTERALAAHRASRKALERRRDFDEAGWLATARRLHATVEERRLPGQRSAPTMTEPDISLHGSLHGSADSAGPADAPDPTDATDPDISLHRAGLMPAEGRPYIDRELQAFRARVHERSIEAMRRPGQTLAQWLRQRDYGES